MIAPLLAAMLCWLPPLLDCNGNVEQSGRTYVHDIRVTHLVGMQPCDPDDPTMGMCPIYAYGPTSHVSTAEDPCVIIPDPGVGDIVYVTTTITDGAGNEDACGP